MNFKLILSSVCQVSGAGEERNNCVVCHFLIIVYLLFEDWGKGTSC